MTKCIWCLKETPEVTFDKKAHIVPQNLGGKIICPDVCDDCNFFFGTHKSGTPSVELMLKEMFHISRLVLLTPLGEVGKNKAIVKPDSTFYKINLQQKKITLKPTLKQGFSQTMLRQFKRGLYKILLETIHEKTARAFDTKFDFIRQFAFQNFGEYPIYYLRRKIGAILLAPEVIKHPYLLFQNGDSDVEASCNDYGFISFDLLTHNFMLPTHELYELSEKAALATIPFDEKLFFPPIKLEKLTQIDWLLQVLSSK